MVDEQLDLLLEDIAAISPEIGRDKIDRSKFDLFRHIYLTPLRLEEADPRYSGEGVDLFVLVEEASREELSDVPDESFQPALEAWRTAMFPIIRSNAASEREAAFRNRVSAINRDSSDQINIMIDRSKRWSERQGIDYQGFITIYGLCSTRRMPPSGRPATEGPTIHGSGSRVTRSSRSRIGSSPMAKWNRSTS